MTLKFLATKAVKPRTQEAGVNFPQSISASRLNWHSRKWGAAQISVAHLLGKTGFKAINDFVAKMPQHPYKTALLRAVTGFTA